MSTFLQVFLRSLETGGVYALAALGIIIIFRTSNITHFAQGSMGMFNTFVVATLVANAKLPLWLATLCGLCTAIILGCLVDFVIIRRTKRVSPVAKQIITLGLIMVFVGLAPMIFGVDPMKLPRFIESGDLNIFGAHLTYNGLFNMVLGVALMLALFYVLQKTKMGIAIRTTAPVITTYVNVSDAIPPLVASDIKGKFDVYGNGWVDYYDEDNLALYTEWVGKIDPAYGMNAYAQTGWIAAHFFCEGLRRIEGQDITWENYMKALESAPIQNPFGGLIDYTNGNRAGTQVMNLSKITTEGEGGWELVDELRSMDELVAMANG